MSRKKPTNTAQTVNDIEYEQIVIGIDEVTLGENRTLDEAIVEQIRSSLVKVGLIQPIVLNRNNVIVSGYHRYEACKREGYTTIRANRLSECSEVNEKLIQIHENTMRGGLRFRNKMELCKWTIGQFVSPVGKPKQGSSASGMTAGEIAVAHGFFGSTSAYDHALVIEQCALDMVIDSLDDGTISPHRAYQISKVPKNRQGPLLKRIIAKRSEEAAETRTQHNLPPAVKAKGKKVSTEYSYPTDERDLYHVLRIAPDWSKSVKKICEEHPVSKFASWAAVVCLECPTRHIGHAIEALELWKLHYKEITTIGWNTYPIKCDLNYSSQEPRHIIIAQVDRGEPLACDEGFRFEPYYQVNEPEDKAIELITEIFGNHSEGGGRLLDMDAEEERVGWDIMKLKFKKKKS